MSSSVGAVSGGRYFPIAGLPVAVKPKQTDRNVGESFSRIKDQWIRGEVPDSLEKLLVDVNGGELKYTCVIEASVAPHRIGKLEVDRFFCIDCFGDSDISDLFAVGEWPRGLLPIMEAHFGEICFAVAGPYSGKVVFYDSHVGSLKKACIPLANSVEEFLEVLKVAALDECSDPLEQACLIEDLNAIPGLYRTSSYRVRYSALCSAVNYDRADSVSELLRLGIGANPDPNAKGLCAAIHNAGRSLASLELLLSAGADPNATYSDPEAEPPHDQIGALASWITLGSIGFLEARTLIAAGASTSRELSDGRSIRQLLADTDPILGKNAIMSLL